MNGNHGDERLRRLARRHAAGQVHGRSRLRRRRANYAASSDRLQVLTLVASTLPGLAAVAALLFTWVAVGQANKELRIAEEGQITNRFNAAIGNLGSKSLDIRLGGIYALQRIMQDSSRDQPTIVSVLSAYVRDHAAIPVTPKDEDLTANASTDIRAAMAVLGGRPPGLDGTTIVELPNTHLTGVSMVRPPLRNAALSESVLAYAELDGADLTGADLTYAELIGANLIDSDLDRAHLTGASFVVASPRGSTLRNAELDFCSLLGTDLSKADLRKASLTLTSLYGTRFFGADLREANLSKAMRDFRSDTEVWGVSASDPKRDYTDFTKANLSGANLRGADLTGAKFINARLEGVDLRDAVLVNADFTGADLREARLDGAKRDGARGLPSVRS
ncbi:pentapeptide repeat-containing protein [Streptomyces sp. NPDC057002]|uniref:pentapeptide repeat-containing protein n=1 Tax=Streptomyces sp. NPDC057002 TaxID=3345992 RepID=UPI003624E4A6